MGQATFQAEPKEIAMERTYDRAGREATRTDDAGLTTFTRNNAGFATSETTGATADSGDLELLSGCTAARTLNGNGQFSGIDGYWSGILTANTGATTAGISQRPPAKPVAC